MRPFLGQRLVGAGYWLKLGAEASRSRLLAWNDENRLSEEAGETRLEAEVSETSLLAKADETRLEAEAGEIMLLAEAEVRNLVFSTAEKTLKNGGVECDLGNGQPSIQKSGPGFILMAVLVTFGVFFF
ncbi:hypothetical protein PoB_005675800 [Plakobranchus ocellatus]|uniref:Uncharacterized protein n=1 Tax=Plakobranchus ocellatus TaxID=259542 RepID=A0AAV4CGU2_9GAST|nr:hypothetical protein PoB_005675800 [Plakobranchus ocellatus]